MTTIEMIYNFQQLLETTSPLFHESQRPSTQVVLDFLNRTQDRYIAMKYLGGRTFRENVAIVGSKLDELRPLIVTTTTGVPTTFTALDGMNYAYTSDLPGDFTAYVRSESQVTRSVAPVATDEWVPNKEANYNELDTILTTPFNKPIIRYPIVTLREGTKGGADGLVTIVDAYTTLDDNMLTYVREPDTMVEGTNCEFPEHMHEEIVKLAVSMYLDEYKFKLAQKQPK